MASMHDEALLVGCFAMSIAQELISSQYDVESLYGLGMDLDNSEQDRARLNPY